MDGIREAAEDALIQQGMVLEKTSGKGILAYSLKVPNSIYQPLCVLLITLRQVRIGYMGYLAVLQG